MFKQIRDGLRAAKVKHTLGIASSAIAAGRIDLAGAPLQKAYNLCIDTTFARMMHIELITFWRLTGLKLSELGLPAEVTEPCEMMAALLQERFDAGDYYRDSD